MTSIEIPISPRAVMEEAAHEAREEPEDWDAEIAADPHPPGQIHLINGELVYVFNNVYQYERRERREGG